MALDPGTVFTFRNRDFPEKCRPHIVVVVTPKRKVLYVAASTRIHRVQVRCSRNPLTCIIATLIECPALDSDSAIDCNYGFIDQEYVLTRADSFDVRRGGVASIKLLDQIKGGILKSESVDPIAQWIIRDDADAVAQKVRGDNS